MSEAAERYGVIADGFELRAKAVAAGEWANPSPCTDWTARDVFAHVIDTHRRVLSSLDQQDRSPVEAEDDLISAWGAARSGIAEALEDPGRSQQRIAGAFGEQPFEALVGRLLCSDTLVHTWDLARATGQDEELDSGALARAAEFLAPMDEAIRRPGGFAHKVEPSPSDDAQVRFLKFCGRAV